MIRNGIKVAELPPTPKVERPKLSAKEAYRRAIRNGKVKPPPSRAAVSAGNAFTKGLLRDG